MMRGSQNPTSLTSVRHSMAAAAMESPSSDLRKLFLDMVWHTVVLKAD